LDKPDNTHDLHNRTASMNMRGEEFRILGRETVDRIAAFLDRMPTGPVTPGEKPNQVRALLSNNSLPDQGTPAGQLLEEATRLLFEHSLFNGHPRFWGYITSSPAPIGMLGDLLAASVNSNVAAWGLAPLASEIEAQTVRWIAELIHYPAACGGLLVSGGNMANFVGFLAARKAKTPWDVRSRGPIGPDGQRLRAYVSAETHTWIQKAGDLFGLGTDAIRWIPTDSALRMDVSRLRVAVTEDRKAGDVPFVVVGNAGTVSTGAIDPLREIAAVCREHDLWFHIDGAYGGFAAALPGGSPDLQAISEADSVAVDPHKWLYIPLEAGCVLVRDREILRSTFSYHPAYYHILEGEEHDSPINYFEYGPQNSRGFRALKVWLALRQAGREGYIKMMSDDIRLAQELHRLVSAHAELEAFTHNLSICTFRYVPAGVTSGTEQGEAYLNKLNTELLERLQLSGKAYLSNAVIGGKFLLRASIVNFRTSLEDVEALPEIIVKLGREVHANGCEA
jgi:aromatic-L-amino-acid decarboxylase